MRTEIASLRILGLLMRQPVSGLTHLLGAVLAVAGLMILVTSAQRHGTGWHVLSFSVYSVSLIALYLSSSLYHLLPLSPAGVQAMRRLDHTMVAVLIAGSYTPICLVPLREGAGTTLLAVVWSLVGAIGVIKVFWLDAPRWITVGIYLAMGWLCVFAINPLMATMPAGGLFWLAAGGVFYSVGAVIYAVKWPDPLPELFGFHEVWHLFVMAGSACHWWMMMGHVLPIGA